MPGGSKPGSNNGGGRPKGRLNRATEERLFRQAAEQANSIKNGKKLAKDVLDEFMMLCAGMAATYQPSPPNGTLNQNEDQEKFWKATEMTLAFAAALAKYQSPTFKAQFVMQQTMQQPLGSAVEPKQLPGNVIALDDPEALQRIYKMRIAQVR